LRAHAWRSTPAGLDLQLRKPAADDGPRRLYLRPFVAMLAYQAVITTAGWAIHSNWPIGWRKPHWTWWTHNVQLPPEWGDGDPWWLNWGGHALLGADHYLMARNSGWSWYASVAFTTFGSFVWEYVTEGIFERPSAVDLIITPIVGTILGELRYLAFRHVRKHWPRRWYAYLVLTLLDPTTMFFELCRWM
jgi:hypothetical protein